MLKNLGTQVYNSYEYNKYITYLGRYYYNIINVKNNDYQQLYYIDWNQDLCP